MPMMKRTMALVALLAAVGGCAGLPQTTLGRGLGESPRVLAHRGGRAEYGDNALGAFRQSLDYGILGFETDVCVTKDGVPVIMHDNAVDRTTNGKGPVSGMTLAEFKALKLKGNGEAPPTLAELVDVLAASPNRRSLWVEFEMKSTGPLTAEEYCTKIHSAVSAKMVPGTWAFTSFSTNLLVTMHRLFPSAPTSYIQGRTLTPEMIETARRIGATGVSPLLGGGTNATSRALVDAAHAAGLRVALWMVEDGEAYARARAAGADTVTSDNPILVASAARVAAAKAADPAVNTALIPAAKLQHDSYQWFDRHRKVMAEKDALDPEIVFVGDSITHFWAGTHSVGRMDDPCTLSRWKKAFGAYRTLNLGYGWDRTGNVFRRLDLGEMDGLTPKLIVVHVGGNNFTTTVNYQGNTPEEVAAADVALVKRLHGMVPGAHVAVMAIFPFGAKPGPGHREQHPKANEILAREMAELDYVTYLDITDRQLLPDGTYPKELSADSCHPTDAGYDIWTAALKPVLDRVLPR